ncbi:MAG: tRNA 4-thiouridine(8) synthase ThiI [Clostridiaceae bacterium]|nr:tRNA 4-thiouridine(8) synthase ThiI [Clostridiaceae bacterium]
MDASRQSLILVRLGEVTLKGLNRGKFISRLIGNMKRRLVDLGQFDIQQSHSRIWVRSMGETDLNDPELMAEAVDRLSRVFGLVSVSPAICLDSDLDLVKQFLLDYAEPLVAQPDRQTFKIEIRRVDKTFPLNSYELSCELGDLLLNQWPERLTVRMQAPDLTFFVEIRDRIYLYHDIIEGARGLPVGMSGRGMLLLSGGIDSPVAGYMMASRGMIIDAIYFHTFPYTGPQALAKVEKLASLLGRYAGRINLYVVDFTEIQLELNEFCPQEMLTVVMRRVMTRIASQLASQTGAKALITGESLGQVASQTLEALAATDLVADKPVFRPLIGMDKNDTIAIARRIGSFETSILPYDDCCTVFVSKHPKTHPSLKDAQEAERDLDMDQIVEKGLENISKKEINPHTTFNQ